jgi:hypothetical protein
MVGGAPDLVLRSRDGGAITARDLHAVEELLRRRQDHARL